MRKVSFMIYTRSFPVLSRSTTSLKLKRIPRAVPIQHRYRSTMEAQQGHSKACCNVPPAVSKGYKEKGKYIDLNGMQCYTTGPSNATSAIFIIYDIFGFSPQAIQGADILAHADSGHQYQVFMPDFFLGKPLPHSDFPPDTDEKKKKVGDFFAGPANPPDTAKKVPELLKEIEKQTTGIKKWGSLGMCWGGKVRRHHCLLSQDSERGLLTSWYRSSL